jgi:hypothetical protein
MIKRILLTMALLMLVSSLAVGQNRPKEVHQRVSNTISAEAKAQEKADNWAWEKQPIIDEIRDLKIHTTWLKYRQEKNRIYIKEAKENIANLEFKKAELNKLREKLEPYLEDVVDALDAFIDQDIPYYLDRRKKRIVELRSSLNKYNIPLSEKLRRVFELGLQQQANDYGKMIAPWEDQTLKINGVETQVTILCLGRIAMIYLSHDQKQVGRWNQKTKQWEALPEDMIRDVKKALDMAQRRRGAEIVELPIGAL